MEVNEAVELAHREGILSAASLMVAGPASAHAVAMASRLPDLKVGLHLVLVDGVALLPRHVIPRLVDRAGRLRTMGAAAFRHALLPVVRRQYADEIAAQFEAFRSTGLELDHVNAHEHFHVHPLIAAQVIALGTEAGMRAIRVPIEPLPPLRAVEATPTSASVRIMYPWARALKRHAVAAGLSTADAVFGLRWSGHMTAARMAGLMDNLPGGFNEIYTHPAVADRFAGAADGYRYTEELAALTDPEIVERAQKFVRGGYGDVAEGSGSLLKA